MGSVELYEADDRRAILPVGWGLLLDPLGCNNEVGVRVCSLPSIAREVHETVNLGTLYSSSAAILGRTRTTAYVEILLQ